MNSFKKVILKERHCGRFVEDDIGLIDGISFTITPIKVVGKNKIKLYYKGKNAFRMSEYKLAGAWSDPDTVFNREFFTVAKVKGTEEYEKAELSYYLVSVECKVINPENPNSHDIKTIEFKIKNEKELDQIKFTVSDKEITYTHPVYSEMKVGESYFYYGKGKCILKELYDYPNPSNKICKLVTSSGNTINVKYGDKKLCLDLMAEKNKPSDAFNECLNELLLQPMLLSDKTNNIINLIWQPIEEASHYVIKLYRLENDTEFCKSVYFLKDYYIDRGTHILSIDDLIVSDSYVFVVIAENRSGEIIAKSRGISIASGKPKDF